MEGTRPPSIFMKMCVEMQRGICLSKESPLEPGAAASDASPKPGVELSVPDREPTADHPELKERNG